MKKVTQILIFAFIGVVTISTAKAQTYDPYAVQVINNLIANNGLQATPNAPETWGFAWWNNETPKQIIGLSFYYYPIRGDISFAELKTLQSLDCGDLYVTGLDVTNCTQLKLLNCYANEITKLDVTSCTQLQYLNCCYNRLTELDLTGLDSLSQYYGWNQKVSLTLYENENGEYTCPVFLNNPTFDNSAISYSEGILKSNDTTVTTFIEFIVQTDKPGFELHGFLFLNYSIVGINAPDKIQLKVYPNPANNLLFVEYENFSIIKLYDMLGKEVLSQKANGKSEINIGDLPKGIYIVNIFEEGKVVGITKIVKQ